jgi:hypothetical protein
MASALTLFAYRLVVNESGLAFNERRRRGERRLLQGVPSHFDALIDRGAYVGRRSSCLPRDRVDPAS